MNFENHHNQSATFTIVGAGIAGLTAAIALKQIGIEARIFEASPAFKPVGAGIMLAGNALKAFQQIDLKQSIIDSGYPYNHFKIMNEAGRTLNNVPFHSDKNGIANISIHRATLHEKLLSKINTEQIIINKRSKDIHQNESEVTVEFEDGTQHTTDYLIVAEGINSVIRQKLLPESSLRYAGYTCWRGITENKQDVKAPSETWGKKGRMGIVPISSDELYWFTCKNVQPGENHMHENISEQLAENFKGFHPPIPDMLQNTPSSQIICNDIYDLKPIHQYAFGNVVLIGDAAHATTPNMGQGACQSIEDAVVLAQCINTHSEIKRAFQLFQQKRLQRTHYIVKRSWFMGKVAQLENQWQINLRNLLMRNTPAFITKRQVQQMNNFKL